MVIATPLGYFARVPGAAVPTGPFRSRSQAERVLVNAEQRRARVQQGPRGAQRESAPPPPPHALDGLDFERGGPCRHARRRDAAVARRETRAQAKRARNQARRVMELPAGTSNDLVTDTGETGEGAS